MSRRGNRGFEHSRGNRLAASPWQVVDRSYCSGPRDIRSRPQFGAVRCNPQARRIFGVLRGGLIGLLLLLLLLLGLAALFAGRKRGNSYLPGGIGRALNGHHASYQRISGGTAILPTRALTATAALCHSPMWTMSLESQ